MRWLPATGLTVFVTLTAGCGPPVEPVGLADARIHLSSPKPRYYLYQTIGPGHELPGEGDASWMPLSGADEGKRLVIRYGEDERLEHAAVVAAGEEGRFDVTEEVLFDRSEWRQRAQTTRQ